MLLLINISPMQSTFRDYNILLYLTHNQNVSRRAKDWLSSDIQAYHEMLHSIAATKLNEAEDGGLKSCKKKRIIRQLKIRQDIKRSHASIVRAAARVIDLTNDSVDDITSAVKSREPLDSAKGESFDDNAGFRPKKKETPKKRKFKSDTEVLSESASGLVDAIRAMKKKDTPERTKKRRRRVELLMQMSEIKKQMVVFDTNDPDRLLFEEELSRLGGELREEVADRVVAGSSDIE